MAALTGPQDAVNVMVRSSAAAAMHCAPGLNKIPGFRCASPARRVLRVPERCRNRNGSKELANLLLNEAGVACL